MSDNGTDRGRSFIFHQAVHIAALDGTSIYAIANRYFNYEGAATLNLVTR